ncbi:family 78 glycoside hydrolase catalytic domain [Microbacterium mangrovi]|uniref:family 78 glycoside hydrolase catalytic domain n=1 Tax=Microbacterium mangrovi TaxID=1348253 RepID=UPI0009DEEF56|nr:family 78 glycoside hydrolase catalytic domain [Microbacterium mangrovi]
MSSSQRRSIVAAVTAAALGLSLLSAQPALAETGAPVGVAGLKTDAATNPVGIPVHAPRLAWQLSSGARGVTQSAYQIRVATDPAHLGDANVWDSGKVVSADSAGVAYGGPALAPTTAYAWQVRVWDAAGNVSNWSSPATFETALKAGDPWSGAKWIGRDTSIPASWTDYTVTFHASEISQALGVYLRAADGANSYMWQISQSAQALRPHVKTGGGYSVLGAVPFPTGFDFAARHEYSFTVKGTTIETRVDGALLDSRTSTAHTAPGVVGFRTSGGESGVVSDVTVTGADGTKLLGTTFPSGDRTFTGGTVSNGALTVAGDTDGYVAIGKEVPLLRTGFAIDKQVASARIYAAARGVYQLDLNGRKVGDEELAPGWTDYRTRIQYQTYDVTDQVKQGDNALGGELAGGWYAGRVAMFGDSVYGSDTSLIAQLRIRYTDGTEKVVSSDDRWMTTAGPTTSADLLDGEAYDARRATAVGDWATAGYDDSGWDHVVVRPSATDKLEPQTDPPVRVTQTLSAKALKSPADGTYVYDLGQNMVGHARVTLTGTAGRTARIRVAEVLNPDGSLYTDNFRSAKATDYYTFGADGTATWEPHFTFHGFRYVEITGVDTAPAASDITGVVIGTDNAKTGTLRTSSALVNQLQSNITWGQRGNFVSIPTDTPARDERMGWTGDIDVFANTANYNMDSKMFLEKWLQDLRDTQNSAGAYPGVAPIIPGRFDGGYGSAGWADAGIHVPYSVWKAYGDTQVIRDGYDSMKRYVDYLQASSSGNIRNVGGYNDWLNLDDDTPATVIDTAFMARSTREFAEMAQAIGRTDDATAYRARFNAIKTAYGNAFVAADGTVRGDSQTAYILTIINGLIPSGRQDAVTDRFVNTLKRRDYHLSTGFLGVDGLLPALTAVGRNDIAYRLLQNTDYPSWGYEIGKGATTVWERWNSIMPDGSFGPVGMNSFNHYAYGAVGEWMYRTMAGVSALEPGYRKVLIAPQPGTGVDWVDYSLDTPYGTVSSNWRRDAAGALELDAVVPANTTAEVRIPAATRWAVTEGGKPAASSSGVTFVRYEDGAAVFSVGSGSYSFRQNPVLGHLGDARDAANALKAKIAALADSGALTSKQVTQLGAKADQLVRQTGLAWDSAASATAGDDPIATAAKAATALSVTQGIAVYAAGESVRQAMSTATAAAIRSLTDNADAKLSAAISALVGAKASVTTPTDPTYPGDTATVKVSLQATGSGTLVKPAATLASADGWAVAPTGAGPRAAVEPGQSATTSFAVSVPQDAVPGTHALTGQVTAAVLGATITIPVTATLDIAAPVTVASAASSVASASPGDDVPVSAVLRNVTARTQTGSLRLSGPGAWAAASAPYSLAAGETKTVTGTLTVPYTTAAGATTLTAAVGDTDGQRATTSVGVVLTNSPALVVDHADMGLAASEASHGVTASEHSGTSVEAGLTRRYTNAQFPGGWFEVTVTVPKGQPFAVRMIDTFDGPQTKTYRVLANGTPVFDQNYARTAAGAGTATTQFLVDDPAVSADGTVRLRFQDLDGGYDPSIADIWILPVQKGLDSSPDLLKGAAVTARTTLQAAPGWSTANLVDGKRESIAGGAKGYTSNPPDRAATGVDQWVSFDLGKAATVDTVVLYPRTGTADDPAADKVDGAHFPRTFAIQASDDGTSWTTVRTVTGQPDPGPRPQAYSIPATTTRYLRVAVTELGRPTAEEENLGFFRLQLAEVEAYRLG